MYLDFDEFEMSSSWAKTIITIYGISFIIVMIFKYLEREDNDKEI
jgi:hypothetical protein